MKKALILFLIILSFSSCQRERRAEAITEQELRMDTVCSITVYREDEREVIREAFDLIDEISKTIDMYDEDSELYRLNNEAYNAPFYCSDELYYLIKTAYEITDRTEGAFDLAIGPLVELWGIGGPEARVPSSDELDAVLPLLNWHNIVLDDERKTVQFLIEGMSIDLGALGKGYVADRIVELFKERGVESAIINLGGNVALLGRRYDGALWTVGLQNPNSGRGEYYSTVQVEGKAVVTSGGYERYFTAHDGTIYHHILDYRTGYPVKSDIISSSIIAESSLLCDLLSTSTFALSSEKAIELVNSYGVQAVFLLENGEVIRVNI